MIDTTAIVERNDLISARSSRSYRLLRLNLQTQIEVHPGQFAMLRSHHTLEPLLRRAMAYYRASHSADGTRVEFIYQVLGRGTQALGDLREHDEVDFLGSLGNRFDESTVEDGEALLVAGGVGSAALFLLAENLVLRKAPVRLFIGGASRGDLCGLDDFIELLGSERVSSATVDGSFGEQGFVTAPLERYLDEKHGNGASLFACGPDPMLHRVAQIAESRGLRSQLSLESPMACGFGICVGCAVAVKADCDEGFIYKKVCTDGPVFRGEELHW